RAVYSRRERRSSGHYRLSLFLCGWPRDGAQRSPRCGFETTPGVRGRKGYAPALRCANVSGLIVAKLQQSGRLEADSRGREGRLEGPKPGREMPPVIEAFAEDGSPHLLGARGRHRPFVLVEPEAGRVERQPARSEQPPDFRL